MTESPKIVQENMGSNGPAYANTTGMAEVKQNRTTTQDNSGYEEAVDNNSAQQDSADYSNLVLKSSLPRPLAIVDQLNTHRGSNRAANPYAVDAVDETDDSPIVRSKGIVNDGYYEENREFDPKQAYDKLNTVQRQPHFKQGEIYQTIADAKTSPVRKLSRKLKRSFKSRKRRISNRELDPYAVDLVKENQGTPMGISNFVYEDVNEDVNEDGHHYADLGEAVPKKPEPPTTYPRRKPNKLYEPSEEKKKRKESQTEEERSCRCLRGSQMVKLCLFIIIFLFLVCLFLIIFIITGQLRLQTTSQKGKPSHEKSFSLEPLENIVAKLQANITNIAAQLKEKTDAQKLLIAKLNLTSDKFEEAVGKIVQKMMNETFRKTSQQQAFSIEPLKKTIAELQANLTKMEALLLKKNEESTQAPLPVINGSVSVLELIREFDSKLNVTKDQFKAADGKLIEELRAMNISLMNKIKEVSVGGQGSQAYNGSHGEPGPVGPQGLPGKNGTRGPPGPGNFSFCKYETKKGQSHNQGLGSSATVNKVQPNGYIMIGASCSTVGTQESNLEVNVPNGGGNPNFICTCKGLSTRFPPSGNNIYCILHYWLCPKTT